MKPAHRRLRDNVLSLGAVQLVSSVLPIVSLPYLASTLGVEALGRLAFALSVAQIFVIVTDYGFNLSAPKEIAVHRDDPQRIGDIFCAVTLLRVLLALLGLAVVLLLVRHVERFQPDGGLLLCAYLLVVGNILFPQWLFQGLEKLKAVSVMQIAARLLVFAGIFLFVHAPSDVAKAVLLQASGSLIGGLLALPATRSVLHDVPLRWPSPASLRHELREGWHVFLSSAAVNIYTTSNVFFLGLLASPAAVGYYHVADKLIKGVQMLLGPISNAVYPHVSRLAATDIAGVLAFNRKLLAGLGGGAVVLGIVTHAIAPDLVELFFGPSYAAAVPVLQIFAWLPLMIVVSNILGIQTMLPLGMKQAFSRVLVGAAVVNFALFIPAAHWYGATGAALANLAVELYVAVAMALLLHHANRSPLSTRLPLQRIAP